MRRTAEISTALGLFPRSTPGVESDDGFDFEVLGGVGGGEGVS